MLQHSILQQFMLQDVLGSVVAVAAFAAVLYAPGYLFAFGTNLFGFRRMRLAERSLWALACSFAAVPIAAHLLGRVAGLAGVCWFFLISALGTLLLLLRRRDSRFLWRGQDWRGRDWRSCHWRFAALLVGGWTAFVLLMLVDVQIGKRLYFSVVMADQSYRIAFTDAVLRTGVPPSNPLYFAGTPAPMRYYYFWYVLCAAVSKMAHVSARQAFVASSVWAGFGLLATVQLYTTHYFRWNRKRRRIALALLLVTGADLVPALGQALLQPSLNGDTEWWSVDPIDSWPDSLLWVPHHVASVLCCLLAFLFLWRVIQAPLRNLPVPDLPAQDLPTPALPTLKAQRWADLRLGGWAVVGAAAAFASAAGLSVYVAFGFALLMAAWLVRVSFAGKGARAWPIRSRQAGAWWRNTGAAGLLSAVLLVPYLRELTAGSALAGSGTGQQSAGPPAHLFTLSVRRMIDSELLTGLPMFAALQRTHPTLLDQAIRLGLLLPGLAMELGLYGAVLVLLLWARRRSVWRGSRPVEHAPWKAEAAHETALFFTVSGLVMTMFLSSAVITNNDFGYRAVMLPQFFLSLLTAEVLGSWWSSSDEAGVPLIPVQRRLLGGLLALGVAGLVYWAGLLRLWLPIEAHRAESGYRASPDDAFQIREAFSKLDQVTPQQAVVAFRPIDPTPDRHEQVMVPNEFYQRMLVMDTGRQILNAEEKCAVHFGGDPKACPAIQRATAALYATPAPSAAWAQAYCRQFGVQYLVSSAWDPDWQTATGWPVTLPVIAREPRIRILQCR